MIPPSLALLSFPLFAIILFANQGLVRGTIYTTLVGYLLMPTTVIDLPGLPGIDKDLIVGISLWIGFFAAPDREQDVPKTEAIWVTRMLWTCVALFAIGAVATVLNNNTGIMNGGAARPALGPRDVLAHMTPALSIVPILWAARRRFLTPEAHRQLCIAIVVCATAYSVLALVEVRLSPQINRWVYGYFPHSWVQHFRGGGWRPIIFLDHGLSLGFFFSTAVLCCAALVRSAGGSKSGLWGFLLIYLLGVLVISKNIGALGITLLFLPLVLGVTQRMQLRAASAVAVAFLLYPAIRSMGLLPYDWILSQFRAFSPQRYQSFLTRFVNEDRMLDRALEKPLTGWGRWSRARVFDAQGNDITIADGLWVIRLGVDGLMGFISMFGPMALAIFALARLAKTTTLSPTTTVFAVVLSGNLIYLVPNSTLSPIAWLMTGGILGLVEFGQRASDNTTPTIDPRGRGRSRGKPTYSRFAPGESGGALRREL